MKNKVFLLLLAIAATACTQKNTQEHIVLKIGNFELSEYVLQKKVARMFQPGQPKSKKALQNFKDGLTDSYFLIADAYQKRYDTIAELCKKQRYNADYLMISKGSYLWNHTEEPKLQEASQLTPELIKKRSKLYYFTVVNVNDKESFCRLVKGDTVLNNLSELAQVIDRCDDYLYLSHYTTTMQWPFSQFGVLADSISNMQEKQISDLLPLGSTYFYFYLDHIEAIELTDEEKENFTHEIRMIKEHENDLALDAKMHDEGKPRINPTAFNTLLEFIRQGNELRDYPEDPLVITYSINNQEKNIHFQQFIEPAFYYPRYPVVGTEKELTDALLQYFYNDYLINQARQLDLYNNPQFLADCKVFMDSYVYYQYIDDEIKSRVNVDTSEVEQHYTQHKNEFTEPEALIFNCYFFEDAFTALNNQQAIQQFYSENSPDMIMESKYLYNLTMALQGHKVKMQNNPELNNTSKSELKNIPPGGISQPIAYRNKHVLFFRTGDEGSYQLELADVYSSIENRLHNSKSDSCLVARQDELKKKYELEIDKIDIRKL